MTTSKNCPAQIVNQKLAKKPKILKLGAAVALGATSVLEVDLWQGAQVVWLMDNEEFNIEQALKAAIALEIVLQRRTHKVKYLGQEYLVPGTLGGALKLPKITAQLQSPGVARNECGLDAFQALWGTLSKTTRHAVLQEIGWYDPKDLNWDDHRSNRRPLLEN